MYMYCRYFPAEIRIYIVEDTVPAFRESLKYINDIFKALSIIWFHVLMKKKKRGEENGKLTESWTMTRSVQLKQLSHTMLIRHTFCRWLGPWYRINVFILSVASIENTWNSRWYEGGRARWFAPI